MNKLIAVPIISLLLLCIIFPHCSSCADTQAPDMDRYNTEKKDPRTAEFIATFFPSFGHYYAEDWGRSAKYVLGEITVTGLTMVAVGNAFSEKTGTESLVKGFGITMVGLVILTVIRNWEIADAVQAARDFNERLKKKYNISIIHDNGPLFVKISYDL